MDAQEKTPLSENMQKYLNYQEQFKRLDKALKNRFYLEAVFIEYAIIEDRTEAVLRHAGQYEVYIKSLKGRYPTIDSKLKRIRMIAREKTSLPNKYFTNNQIDATLAWKDKRNGMIHALMKQALTTEALADLADEGKRLAREICSQATNYKRAVERKQKKQVQP